MNGAVPICPQMHTHFKLFRLNFLNYGHSIIRLRNLEKETLDHANIEDVETDNSDDETMPWTIIIQQYAMLFCTQFFKILLFATNEE